MTWCRWLSRLSMLREAALILMLLVKPTLAMMMRLSWGSRVSILPSNRLHLRTNVLGS